MSGAFVYFLLLGSAAAIALGIHRGLRSLKLL